MKIGMQTWGSHGDIRPFLALARGLRDAGHDVHLVVTSVDSDLRDVAAAADGFRVTVLASPVLDARQQEALAATASTIRNPMTQMAAILRQCFAPVEDAMFAQAERLCAESDVVIGHFFMHPLQIAAERAGRPYVSVLLSYVGVPTDFGHPLGTCWLGRPVHRMLWRLARTLINRALLPYPNRLRARLGMPPVRDMIGGVWLSRYLTLLAVSPALCAPRPDWPDALHVCGFLDAPGLGVDGRLPDALADFLAAGAAPVYMTFGSWMPADAAGQARALQLLTRAARLAGCRAIIQSPSAQACGFMADRDVLYVAKAPHDAIFPHCGVLDAPGMAARARALADAMRRERGVDAAVARITRRLADPA